MITKAEEAEIERRSRPPQPLECDSGRRDLAWYTGINDFYYIWALQAALLRYRLVRKRAAVARRRRRQAVIDEIQKNSGATMPDEE